MAEAASSNGGTETDMEGAVAMETFIQTGRTGRRNAMPDILHSKHAAVGTGGLAEDMEKLNCAEGDQSSGNSQNTQSQQGGQGS